MQEYIADVPAGYRDSNMMTPRETAKLLGVSLNTLRRWSDNGIIRAYRICPRGDRRFPREAITRFVAELHANRGNEKMASLNTN